MGVARTSTAPAGTTVGSSRSPSTHCLNALEQRAVGLRLCTASLLGAPSAHCHTTAKQCIVGPLQDTATLLGSSGHWNSYSILLGSNGWWIFFRTPPHCWGAVAVEILLCTSTCWGAVGLLQVTATWVVDLPQHTATMLWSSRQWISSCTLPQCRGAMGRGAMGSQSSLVHYHPTGEP